MSTMELYSDDVAMTPEIEAGLAKLNDVIDEINILLIGWAKAKPRSVLQQQDKHGKQYVGFKPAVLLRALKLKLGVGSYRWTILSTDTNGCPLVDVELRLPGTNVWLGGTPQYGDTTVAGGSKGILTNAVGKGLEQKTIGWQSYAGLIRWVPGDRGGSDQVTVIDLLDNEPETEDMEIEVEQDDAPAKANGATSRRAEPEPEAVDTVRDRIYSLFRAKATAWAQDNQNMIKGRGDGNKLLGNAGRVYVSRAVMEVAGRHGIECAMIPAPADFLQDHAEALGWVDGDGSPDQIVSLKKMDTADLETILADPRLAELANSREE